MTENDGHILIDVPYQGNWWWLAGGLFSAWLIYYVLLTTRRKRKAGIPVDIRAAIAACLVALLLTAVSLFQVLTHEW